jgi:hypothetical protein
MALVEGLRGEFADHDVYLHLLLGLVSASRRLERLLPDVPPSPPAEPQAALSADEEGRVLALLGLISVRRTLMGMLEARSAQSGASRAPEVDTAPAAPGETLALLR